MPDFKNIFEHPDAEYDPNSDIAKRRRAEFQEDPAADIHRYLEQRQAPRDRQRTPPRSLRRTTR